MNVLIDVKDKNPLVGVFVRVWMTHIIQNIAMEDVENYILKRNPSLVYELLVLLWTPVESLHEMKLSIDVCLLSSIKLRYKWRILL